MLGGRPLTHLTELSRFVYEIANLNHRNNQPFVGQSAFAHKGGMHVHAIARATSSYEHIDPAAGRQRAADSGQRAFRADRTSLALTAKHKLTDDKALMDAILKQVVGSGERKAISSRRPRPRSTCWCSEQPACFSRTSSG